MIIMRKKIQLPSCYSGGSITFFMLLLPPAATAAVAWLVGVVEAS